MPPHDTDLTPLSNYALGLIERGHAYAQKAKAPNTVRTYESLWRDFAYFAQRMKAEPLPGSPALVIAYLSELAPIQRPGTLANRVAAIRHFHEQARLPDPTRDTAVTDVLKGIKREHGKPPARKKAVDRDILLALLRVQPQTLRGTRNRALLLVGYACDLRRSELAALRRDDVEFLRDRMIVTITHSKTDQHSAGYQIHVPRLKQKSICAVHALETWLAVGKIEQGPLFREVDRWENVGLTGLTDQVVNDVVKEAAKAAGYNPRLFGAHGLRRGLITQAARNRENTGDIRKVSRHKTEVMIDVYREEAANAQMRVIGNALTEEAE